MRGLLAHVSVVLSRALRVVACVVVSGAACGVALADDMRVPAAAPKAWRAECASCHVAYPPGLLVASDWQRLMAGLDKHFGTDAALTASEVKEITAFLVANAATRSRNEAGGNAPRITQTEWFQSKHRDVPAAAWKDGRIKTASNCMACHTRADADSYSEREIRVPGLEGRRW
jgi:nitrate/TMAO reductase-like tetraheme cytochrome c subunit